VSDASPRGGPALAGLGLLLRKELREQVRTLRLPVIVILFAILGMLSPVLARYIQEIVAAVGGDELTGMIPEPGVADAAAQFTKNLGQFGVLAAILVTMGSVAGEKERGTAAFLLTKPLSRGAFLFAKVLALGLLLALATAVAGVLCWIYAAVLFEPLPVAGFTAAVFLVWLSLSVFAALTFLASVVARSAIVAGGIGIGALLVAGILSALPIVGSYLPTSLWGLADQLAVGLTPDVLLGPVVFNVAIIAVAVALSGWSFQRQEL
jgi:ABC-2 type transport system permease protein